MTESQRPATDAHPNHDALAALDGAQEIDFEWARRFRDAGIALNPPVARRVEAREAFLARVHDELAQRRTASRR